MLFDDQFDNSTNISEYSHSYEKVSLDISKINRSFVKRTKTISSFYKNIKSKISPNKTRVSCPKKEYIRCKIIRGTKKSIRLLSKKSNPKKIGKFNIISNEVKAQWNLMAHHFNSNKEILKTFSSTKDKIPGKEFKSYNISFCKMFFEMPEVREAFNLYVNYIFTDYDCKRLCKEFNFKCCLYEKHGYDCEKNWRKLKEFILRDMINELGFSVGECKDLCEKYDEDGIEIREEDELEEEKIEEIGSERVLFVETQPKWIQRMILKEVLIL
ncbi:hypothetical protein SteCoe_6335 [Stentor coeruleus]|uniref:Uncharacterized protein n=1 Tax=Stentor coeruleus TaxID=5963 RepID=A0A1R2CQ89_9CILI|nr:hypothetical protein SteCoe_6335 [Stentor coeruleus]